MNKKKYNIFFYINIGLHNFEEVQLSSSFKLIKDFTFK